MRSRWERRKEIDAGQVAEEDDTFVGFNVHGKVVSENCNSGDSLLTTFTRPAFPRVGGTEISPSGAFCAF